MLSDFTTKRFVRESHAASRSNLSMPSLPAGEPCADGWRIPGCKTVAVVGSRDYPDLEAVRRFVDSLPAGTVAVSGGARGVDRTAEQRARSRNLAVQSFRPARDPMRRERVLLVQWSPATGSQKVFLGPVFPTFAATALWRNSKIVEVADAVKAFHDGVSRGTADTMRKARAAGKLLP